MSGWMEQQVYDLVRTYGKRRVLEAVNTMAPQSNSALIVLNKAQSLPLAEREEFYRFVGATLAELVSDENARHACRLWDEHTGEAWLEKLRRRVA